MVTLHSFLGVIEKVVVADYGDVIAVTSVDEVDRASREGRKPAFAGFKKADILNV